MMCFIYTEISKAESFPFPVGFVLFELCSFFVSKLFKSLDMGNVRVLLGKQCTDSGIYVNKNVLEGLIVNETRSI
jgi:hypothetical protein